MSETSTSIDLEPAAAPAAAAAPAEHEITLEQFAIELSARDNRVELINAFVFTERVERHFKDLEGKYNARFQSFLTKPV